MGSVAGCTPCCGLGETSLSYTVVQRQGVVGCTVGDDEGSKASKSAYATIFPQLALRVRGISPPSSHPHEYVGNICPRNSYCDRRWRAPTPGGYMRRLHPRAAQGVWVGFGRMRTRLGHGVRGCIGGTRPEHWGPGRWVLGLGWRGWGVLGH